MATKQNRKTGQAAAEKTKKTTSKPVKKVRQVEPHQHRQLNRSVPLPPPQQSRQSGFRSRTCREYKNKVAHRKKLKVGCTARAQLHRICCTVLQLQYEQTDVSFVLIKTVRKFLVLISFALTTLNAVGQSNRPIAGEYMLYGEMEMAAGFKLDSNGQFLFYFSYGALDREGKGRWRKEGDQLVLNSNEKDTKDFVLTQSKKTPAKQLTIYIDAPPDILRYVTVTGVSGAKRVDGTANEK